MKKACLNLKGMKRAARVVDILVAQGFKRREIKNTVTSLCTNYYPPLSLTQAIKETVRKHG